MALRQRTVDRRQACARRRVDLHPSYTCAGTQESGSGQGGQTEQGRRVRIESSRARSGRRTGRPCQRKGEKERRASNCGGDRGSGGPQGGKAAPASEVHFTARRTGE